MTLEPGVAALVLAAALMHAAWNALVKSAGEDRLSVFAGVVGVPMAAGAAVLPFLPAPAAESWPYIGLSAAIHVLYFTALLASYRFGDLSHVYPLARGLAPLLVAVASVPLAGDSLGPGAFAGAGLVSLGIGSLAFTGGGSAGPTPRATLYALLTGLAIAAYLVVDGIGVRLSGAPLAYVAWMFVLSGLPLVAVAIARGGLREGHGSADAWRRAAGGGLLAFASYAVAVWAMSRGGLAHVTALRETSVLFAALIGVRVLGEPFGLRRVLAAAAVAAGLAAMNLLP